MKVLILHQHFNTPKQGGALRSYYLAKALVDHGIETVVITGTNEKASRIENVEGVEVHYLPVAYANDFGFMARSFSFLKYVWRSVRTAQRIEGIDLCYAISTPLTVGLSAMWLKRKMKTPFIFEVGDLWPDAPIQMGFIRSSFFAQILLKLERKIYREATSIVALSEDIKYAIEQKISGKKIHVIPNIADCEFYKPETKDVALEEKLNVKNKVVVSYIGTVGVANGLEHFIDCAAAAQGAGIPLHFICCGDGAMLPSLKASAESRSLKNISFTGFVDRNGVKEIMNVTDAVVVSYQKIPILETGSPNKYFDALASGKVIIVNFGGWIKNEIEKTGCGFYVDPQSSTEFVTRITSLINDQNKIARMQRQARALAESSYDRKKLSAEFAQLFSS